MAQTLMKPRNICICNTGVFIKVKPFGKTIGTIINKPIKLRKKTNCGAGSSEEAILIHIAMTAKQQAEPKAGKKP